MDKIQETINHLLDLLQQHGISAHAEILFMGDIATEATTVALVANLQENDTTLEQFTAADDSFPKKWMDAKDAVSAAVLWCSYWDMDDDNDKDVWIVVDIELETQGV